MRKRDSDKADKAVGCLHTVGTGEGCCVAWGAQDVMKYVGGSSSAAEHKAIKESPGKFSQLET